MSIAISLATSPEAFKAPADWQEFQQSPVDSFAMVSPSESVSLQEAVANVVYHGEIRPADAQVTLQLEFSIQAARTAMDSLRKESLTPADVVKVKGDLQTFGQLYSRLIRKAIQLYTDEIARIGSEKGVVLESTHDMFRGILLHFMQILNEYDSHAEDFPGLHQTLSYIHEQLGIEDARNTLDVFDTFFNATRAYHLPFSMQELEEMVQEGVPKFIVVFKRLEVLEDLNSCFVSGGSFRGLSSGVVLKQETDKLIRDCHEVFQHASVESRKTIENRLSNFLEIEIECMRELIALDESSFRSYGELRDAAANSSWSTAVAEYVANLDRPALDMPSP